MFVNFHLKELIQNAEDAGASEVKFMYDETEYGVESLWSPDLAQHQGETSVRRVWPVCERDCNSVVALQARRSTSTTMPCSQWRTGMAFRRSPGAGSETTL